ncbi:hypothetical protein JK159_02455 [Weissella minor]|uniref:hypothetical protein n=1 Tax=Weissella minor TaxID=1620 RepID=UPI001BB00C21|nr:hypothetical protein [Weissella minor]MBS0949245.1 hypothetical protein [Weissella minor]
MEQLTQKQQAKLKRRMNILEKKFADDPTKADQEVLDEVKQIQLLLTQLNRVEELIAEDISVPRNTPITNNLTEEWYRAIFLEWLSTHTSALKNIKTSKSAIYTFALHFFVDNIVLNPKNAALKYEQLVDKLNRLNERDADLKKINFELADIRSILSFLNAMQFEVNTLPVEGSARQLTPGAFGQLRTEVNQNSDLGQAMQTYKKQRQGDLTKKQTRQTQHNMEW